jgi:DNA-directed RNA polymerase subunit RPC12/RpoP
MVAPAKPDRMEMRRAIGNREVRGPSTPQYHRGPDYLIAHACFVCRKSWKRPEGQEYACPECGNALALMGRTFRVPAKRQDDQWEKVRRLWEAGFRFWSYRSFPDAERYPEHLRDVGDFISRNGNHPMRTKTNDR